MAHTHQKRIVVCCDGTWMDSDNGYDSKSGVLQVPSNVTRFVRSLKAEGARKGPGGLGSGAERDDYIPQIKYYQAGVGTGTGLWDHLVGGGTGLGLSEHIREAYAFIANNYREPTSTNLAHDEIFLLGFSRGAFTARSIAGFIGYVGLLTRKGMDHFYEIFKDYENAGLGSKWKSPFPDRPFKGKPSMCDKAGKKLYQDMLVENGLTRLNIPIKAVAVWDTVGSLGIPTISWIDKLHLPFPSSKELLFFNTKLDNMNIEHAFQALALDEMRWSFPPAVWELPPDSKTVLKQTWFPGVHSNIGGGMDDQQLSDITLAWMLSQLDGMLDFDQDYVFGQWEATRKKEEQLGKSDQPKNWSFGEIDTSHNSALYAIAGDHSVRTPGQYRQVEPLTGATSDTTPALRNPGEHIHASVRIRLGLRGPGINEKVGLMGGLKRAVGLGPNKEYRAEALLEAAEERHAWRCVVESRGAADPPNPFSDSSEAQKRIYWEVEPRDLQLPDGFPRTLPEDVLGWWEKELLKRSPDAWGRFWTVVPEP
ncbi:MAG: hypothetical protein M1839_000951 [Geoglossum umbratile]|nr:MAG: hypothetical protein M1839_000951 [Geoglossum umbratile]